jgi:hypothetical protein
MSRAYYSTLMSRGKKDAAEAGGAEEGGKGPSTPLICRELRPSNNARHRTLRMKIPEYTCAFMPGRNDPRSAAASPLFNFNFAREPRQR